MYDMNFELLTMLYYYFKRHETYDRLDEFILALSILYKKEKFFGAVVNLCFTTDDKMREQLDINPYEIKDIATIFKNSIQLLDNMKTLEIIPEETKFLYGIEGLSRIENENKLVELYNLSLRSISNSHLNDKEELTTKDLELIKKAIELRIIININKTSYESLAKVIELINKNSESEPIVIFNEENLDDLRKLPNASYYILVTQNRNEKTKEEKELSFINRIKLIKDDEFFSKNKIILCKSNKDFSPKTEIPILQKDENTSTHLRRCIINEFGLEFANQIMFENASCIFEKVLNYETRGQKKYIA